MNPLDVIIIIIVGYGFIRGIFRGMVKEISSIVGVFAGFYAAYSYYPLVSEIMADWITNVPFLNILSFMLIFCVIFFIISIIGVIIKYLMHVASLGWMDRLLGASLGFGKAVLIVSIILVALTAFLPKGAPIIKTSLLSPHITVISEKLAQVISIEMKQAYTAKLEEIKKAWNVRN
jgi:membrane protein required for colicin V production